MIVGRQEFDTENRCYIMGILNVTPDSFSDGGKWNDFDAALGRAEYMIGAGADIIDIGGESSRPGSVGVSLHEEIDRVMPVIEALGARFDVPLSIDTCKSAVAEAAVGAGVVLVNDIWGLKRDPDIAGVIARSGAACCLMHNRDAISYVDFIRDMLDDLIASASKAEAAGVPADKIILDPGIGFAKTYEMNLEAINRIDAVKGLGYPVMLGVSRKSVIGMTLGLPEAERVEGSLAAAIVGVVRGCSFLRVHDVMETKRAVMMAEAILGARGQGLRAKCQEFGDGGCNNG